MFCFVSKINCYLFVHAQKFINSSQKELGNLRTTFLNFKYRYPEVENIFVNISAKEKIFPKYFGGFI